MITLKDIKVSRDLIPVQNALWLRPMGLCVKLYYPKCGIWKEVELEDDGNPDPSPSPTPTPGGDTIINNYITNVYGSKELKPVVCKTIPVSEKSIDRITENVYYFGSSVPRFLYKSTVYGIELESSEASVFNYTDGLYHKRNHTVPMHAGIQKHHPILFKPLSKEDYDKEIASESDYVRHVAITFENITVYGRVSEASTLTCDTASPYFKIIDGYCRCIKESRFPKIKTNAPAAEKECKRFIVKHKNTRGRVHYDTKEFHWTFNEDLGHIEPAVAPYNMKHRWKKFNIYRLLAKNVTNRSGLLRVRFVSMTELYKKRKAKKIYAMISPTRLPQFRFKKVEPRV